MEGGEAAGCLEGAQSLPHQAATLDSLEPDAFAAVCEHLRHREVAALAASSAALRYAVTSNDRLWSSMFAHQFPLPWRHLTRARQQLQQQQQQGEGAPGRGRASSATAGVVPGGWRDMFLRTHTACQQLVSTGPECREWTTDATAVHLVVLHGTGQQRLTLTVQGSGVELRCDPSLAPHKSFQLFGHGARVAAAAFLAPAGFGGPGAEQHRIGLVTACHDQFVRLWSLHVDPESYEFRRQPLSLATPLRTLRGHQEAVTSLRLMSSGTGVTIAATGGKDRTVRLWGLAPLVPSPVQKPQIATLRGHGAPITCLAVAGGGGSGGWDGAGGGGSDEWGGSSTACGGTLLSGSLDSRAKAWDPWTAACTGTAKCAAPVTALAPAAAAPLLQPHAVLAAVSSGVQVLDLRCMRAVAGVVLPAKRNRGHCISQHGWDLAVGSSDGSRVFDLRCLSSAFSASPAAAGSSSSGGSGSGSSGAAGRAAGIPERLRLLGRGRPVSSIHVDRHKVVTASARYGAAPLRVWCAVSGEGLAELGSCLAAPAPVPAPEARAAQQQGRQQGAAGSSDGIGGGRHASGDEAEDDGWGTATDSEAEDGPPAAAAYRHDWRGVTALACRGALLVTGSSEGTVVERDFGRGGLPELDHHVRSWEAEAAGQLAGKFWQPSSGLGD